MKVFISWSGEVSKSVASILREYIPMILKDVDPFMSAHDIESGTKWAQRLTNELEQSQFGIMCLTNENLDTPWLLFEAGAVSKFAGRVCGLLIGAVKMTDISGPLSHFQHRRFIEGDIKQMLSDLNITLSEPLDSKRFDKLFAKFWPDILREYEDAVAAHSHTDKKQRGKTDREILEELLFRMRAMELSTNNGVADLNLTLDDILHLPVSRGAVEAYSKLRFPNLSISDVWQLRLLADIDPQKYQYIRDIDNALTRAWPALEEYSRERPELFRHSTDYLTKALGFTDEQFRQIHGFGAESRKAFIRLGARVKRP